ncbi:hypothetical protein D3C75_803670 [compost metagenome]|jgi:hypothetical protein|nr:DUF4124 domain-containing protein [Pseudomonas sp.]
MRPIHACLLLALALPASAEIYRYTDERGNPVYTNQPPQGVATESVQLGPTNTVAAPVPAAPPQSDSEAELRYSRLEITGVPDDDATLRANAGNFTVGVSLEPSLQADDLLQVLLDGQPLTPPGTQTSFQLGQVDRGTHSLQAVILRDGKPLQSSATVSFTLQRVHTKSPAFPRPQPLPAN